MASILEAAATSMPEGELSTRIMYGSNTSQVELKKYLGLLQNFELLERDNDSKRYKITNRGVRFLALYSRLREELKTLE